MYRRSEFTHGLFGSFISFWFSVCSVFSVVN
jgi:hypothetical protein